MNFEKSALFITQAWKADGSLGEPKANERRAIYIPDRTVELLRIWKSKLLFPESEHFVFFGEYYDKPLHNKTCLSFFMSGAEKAGIETEDRNLKLHSLRHSYNTIMRGLLPETVLREFTGHRSESMTNRYDRRDYLLERLAKSEPAKQIVDEVF